MDPKLGLSLDFLYLMLFSIFVCAVLLEMNKPGSHILTVGRLYRHSTWYPVFLLEVDAERSFFSLQDLLSRVLPFESLSPPKSLVHTWGSLPLTSWGLWLSGLLSCFPPEYMIMFPFSCFYALSHPGPFHLLPSPNPCDCFLLSAMWYWVILTCSLWLVNLLQFWECYPGSSVLLWLISTF